MAVESERAWRLYNAKAKGVRKSHTVATHVLARCTYLVEGVATTDCDAPLTDGSAVDVLPPFSGG
ncbi:MoaD/ThiS family protein [Clavibacter michiganensis]|uniref:MoaD/ThiS family protein n=1 Tax=Clavibacter michiganensis TaxID=28447 RepID=UPI003EBE2938